MARSRRTKEGVELNLAAMLDMAFQLLTFFILTFKPAPVEGQNELRMPPPLPTRVIADQPPGALFVSIFSTPDGQMQSLWIGENQVAGTKQLDQQLRQVFHDPGNPFGQVIIQVDRRLQYEQLMKVIDVCSRQTLVNGQPLAKLSFLELPAEPR